MTDKTFPTIVRKHIHRLASAETRPPRPSVDWTAVVQNIQDLRAWFRVSNDENTAEALFACLLLLDAIDESRGPVELVEAMLPKIGQLAFAWASVGDLPRDLQRRVEVVALASIDNMEKWVRLVESRGPGLAKDLINL